MQRISRSLAAIVPGVMLFLTGVASANITGSLSTPGGVTVGGTWTSLRIAWDISQVGTNWLYKYTVSSDMNGLVKPTPNMSHLIIQVSDTFTAANGWGYPGTITPTVGDYKAANANPGWPSGTMHGLKLDTPQGDLSFSFYSDRAPQWSDFYAKGGSSTFAYNKSWGVAVANQGNYMAASALDASGNALYKILAPDTRTVVPAPGAAVLGFLGLSIIGAVRRRFA